MTRLYTMARFEERPALPTVPAPENMGERHAAGDSPRVRKPRHEHYVVDSPEQVALCLCCPKLECTNCLAHRRGKPYVPVSERKRRACRKE